MLSIQERNRLTEVALAIRDAFDEAQSVQWDALTIANELSVQLGHLALCILQSSRPLAASAVAEPRRNIADIGDELCDCYLQALVLLARFGQKNCISANVGEDDDAISGVLMTCVLVGRLTEAAMEVAGMRHLREDRPSHRLGMLSGMVCNILEQLSALYGLDLATRFEMMAAEALGAAGKLRGEQPTELRHRRGGGMLA